MPIDKQINSAADALKDVSDGATVLISGFGGAGFPNVLIRALRERGPRDLTLVVNSATHRFSLTHELIEAGLVRKVICSAARGQGKELSPFEQLWKAGRIELVCLPQGTFAECIRAGGAGIPAFYTPVGLGTELTRGKEVRRFGERDYVLEEAIKGAPNDAAIHYHLGMTYAKLSNSTDAVTHLKKAAALAPNTQTAKDADKELALLS